MKAALRLPLVCLLALFPLAMRADDLTATIKREAQKCADAFVAGDYEGIVHYTHPRLIKLMGGKEAMIATLKEGVAEMQASGAGIISATAGTPQAPKKIGTWIASIVPEHLVMKVQGGKLIRDSYLLGISEDGGRTWVFVDIGQTSKEQFAQVFPELDGKITLPEPKKGVFEESK